MFPTSEATLEQYLVSQHLGHTPLIRKKSRLFLLDLPPQVSDVFAWEGWEGEEAGSSSLAFICTALTMSLPVNPIALSLLYRGQPPLSLHPTQTTAADPSAPPTLKAPLLLYRMERNSISFS